MTERIEVAQIITRCIAGSGGVAVRGASFLDPDRFHTTIITGLGGTYTEQAADHGMDVIIEPSLVSPIAPAKDTRALGILTALCRDRGFDVVHTHSAKAGALGRVAARRAGVPWVVHTYHGFPFHDFQSPLRRAAYLAIERRLASITDVVLGIGGGVSTEALRLGLARPEGLRTVAPAVDANAVERTPATVAAAYAALGIDPGTRVIGTVGRCDHQKAPHDMVRAVAAMRHREVVFVWIGSGPLLDQARRWAADLGVSHRFRFIGERNDVPQLLPALELFVMSSHYEGLPCALVEAMRCGLPAIATSVNSVPDLVVPGESGVLVLPGHPEMLTEAIDHLLDHPDVARRLAANGNRAAAMPFDAAVLGEVLTDVYSRGTCAPAPELSRLSA